MLLRVPHANGQWNCSTILGWRIAPTTCPTRFPAASNSASPWPGCSPRRETTRFQFAFKRRSTIQGQANASYPVRSQPWQSRFSDCATPARSENTRLGNSVARISPRSCSCGLSCGEHPGRRCTRMCFGTTKALVTCGLAPAGPDQAAVGHRRFLGLPSRCANATRLGETSSRWPAARSRPGLETHPLSSERIPNSKSLDVAQDVREFGSGLTALHHLPRRAGPANNNTAYQPVP